MNSLRKLAVAGALVGATGAGFLVGSTVLGTANAQTTPSTQAPTQAPSGQAPSGQAPSGQAPSGQPPQGGHGQGQGGPHQANGKTETPLTGDDLAKVTAGVEAKVPGATIVRAETDADGDAYEAHITKSDGSEATVKFDASFNVTNVVNGRG